MGDFNVDSFALELMRKVWEIGNRHGPDTQRKAQIQIAIAEAVAPLMGRGEPVGYVNDYQLDCIESKKTIVLSATQNDHFNTELYTHPAPAVDGAVTLGCYDAGYLNDYGGGNVEWWQDYIRAEIARAHDFYQSQVDSAMKREG